MKSLFKLTVIDLKLYLRNYIASFFTLVFPVLMLLLFGVIYGNKPVAVFGGYGSMDFSVPGYIAALVIGTTAFMSLPMDLSVQRQLGVLRRLRATPLGSGRILASKLITNLVVAAAGMGLLVLTGVLAFQIVLPVNWPALLLGILLCSLSMYSLGFALASLVRTANGVRAVSFIVFYPMMFLSGGTFPSQFLPEAVNQVAKALPMTYSVNLLHSLWFGQGWDATAILALLGFMALGVLLSVRFFKWD